MKTASKNEQPKTPTRERFTALCDLLGWQRSDGPILGVWSNKLPGDRCLWSCRWATQGGTINPWDLLDINEAGAEQLAAELQDVLDRSPDETGRRLLVALVEDHPCIPPALEQVRNYVGQARLHYPEYIAPWSPPAKIHADLYRPRWEYKGKRGNENGYS